MSNIETMNLSENGAFYITSRSDRRYFSGVDVSEGIVVVYDDTYYFTDARYYYGVKDELSKFAKPMLYTGEESIKELLAQKGVTTLLVDYDITTVSEYNSLKKWGYQIKDCSKFLKDLRVIKDGLELESIEKACKIAQNAYHTAITTVKSGMTEIELKDAIEALMLEAGAESVSFETIVAFGKNSAVPHHQTGKTALKDGDVILVDMGCKVNGYCSDLTRTAFFGQPSKEFLSVYQAVKRANELAEENIYGGISVKEADNVARAYLTSQGYGEYFTHSLGHGVGLDIHEAPTLSQKGQGTLEEGCVFTVEPGVYLDGKFGVRIEDTVVIVNNKVKRLFSDDKALKILV